MGMKPQPQDQQALKCPRCDSSNTKFCYYNNYSLSQPRHFCKACKRYWTRGGTLRSVPIGGGCRKNKRMKQSSVSFDPMPKPPSAATSRVIRNFNGPNETAPYDFYQSQFNAQTTGFLSVPSTSLLNFPTVRSTSPCTSNTSSLIASDHYQAMFPSLPGCGTHDLMSVTNQVKIEEENDLMRGEVDDPVSCMEQFGSIDSTVYWNSVGAWPDFSNYGSSVTSLI